MDEYEIGEVAVGEDGRLYRFNGGDATDPKNWAPTDNDSGPAPMATATPEAAAQARLNAGGGSAVGDFLRMAGQGATFGFGDELAGLVRGRPGSPEYEAARNASRQRVEDLRMLAPGASLASEVAGGVGLPFYSGAGVASNVAARTGSRAVGAAVGGATAGLLSGGLTGAGEAEDGERVMGAVRGGAIGGLFGGALGAGMGGAARLYDHVVGPSGDLARGATGAHAQHQLKRILKEAGVGPDEIDQQIKALGPDAVVADLSPNMGREARATVNQAPKLAGNKGPVRNLERRAAERGERIASDMREASKLPSNYEESLASADEAVKQVRADFFDPIEQQYPVVRGKNVRSALDKPGIREVAERVAPGVGKRPPTFRELQDIMMELRDEATAARTAGRPNASMKAGQRYDDLVGAMEQDINKFPEAQAAYRVAAKNVEAHEMGRAAAYKAPSDIRAELEALPEGARNGYRQGLLDAFERALRERGSGGGTATGLMNAGDTMVQRLQQVAADDPALKGLLSKLDREATYSRTWNALAGNSTTAQQAADLYTQITDVPTTAREALGKFLKSIVGLTESERRASAELLGRALLGKGESAEYLLGLGGGGGFFGKPSAAAVVGGLSGAGGSAGAKKGR